MPYHLCLEQPADSIDFTDVLLGNLGDECAVMRTNLDKPFGFQSPHSLPNWRATDLQLFRYAVLIKFLSRLEIANGLVSSIQILYHIKYLLSNIVDLLSLVSLKTLVSGKPSGHSAKLWQSRGIPTLPGVKPNITVT